MSNKSLAVAQYILEGCHKKHDGAVTPMQLIKMVYIAHGYMLGKNGEPLLDEPIEAWRYGPVVRSVYEAVRKYQSLPVEQVSGSQRWKEDFSNKEQDVMNKVVEVYGGVDGITLSAATHKPNTPWSKTWEQNGRNSLISNDLIENFYRKLLALPTHSSL